jgi:hypothetical protein
MTPGDAPGLALAPCGQTLAEPTPTCPTPENGPRDDGVGDPSGENPRWGYRCIQGELLEPGIRLARADRQDPRRSRPRTRSSPRNAWRALKVQAGGIVATYLHREHRLPTAHLRALLHRTGRRRGVDHRRHGSPQRSVGHPARAEVAMDLDDDAIGSRFPIRDRDTVAAFPHDSPSSASIVRHDHLGGLIDECQRIA